MPCRSFRGSAPRRWSSGGHRGPSGRWRGVRPQPASLHRRSARVERAVAGGRQWGSAARWWGWRGSAGRRRRGWCRDRTRGRRGCRSPCRTSPASSRRGWRGRSLPCSPAAAVKPPKWRSSTQCAAVRITRGAITVPVQEKPRSLLVRAAMNASEGKSAIAATSPPMIEAVRTRCRRRRAGHRADQQGAEGPERGCSLTPRVAPRQPHRPPG